MTPKEDTNLTLRHLKPTLIISYILAVLTMGMAGVIYLYFNTHWILPLCFLFLSLVLFYASYSFSDLEDEQNTLPEPYYDSPEGKNNTKAALPEKNLSQNVIRERLTLRPIIILNYLLVIAVCVMAGVSFFYFETPWIIPVGFLLTGFAMTCSALYYSNLEATHSALKASHKELAKRNAQDEILLKEIHHRVKNNLQTVSSLLSLQARNVDDQNTRELFKNSQHRVISMALIHEMLYAYDDISRIQYQEYVEQLSTHLVKSIKGPENNITLNVSMPDIKLGMDTAVPLGLLINEFITNTLKHGLPEETPGEITITLHKDEKENYLLHLRDNGVGFQEENTNKRPNSLGLRLINNLVRQLRGTITREPAVQGVHFRINFREPQPAVTHNCNATT
ncbi:sensor histidine kinase [Robertkochia flava]|uniref:sensor histidine kinase n=1 Tax=Robertkochia flava TaxID=3447986 RepID=UPI001CCD9825|nr:sensor histidine kinase [Robertkochia marina]